MTSYVFKVVVEPDEHEDGREAYQAYCPDMEEAVTWGDTCKEAVQRIHELLQTLVQMRIEKGLPVPAIQEIESSERKGCACRGVWNRKLDIWVG